MAWVRMSVYWHWMEPRLRTRRMVDVRNALIVDTLVLFVAVEDGLRVGRSIQ